MKVKIDLNLAWLHEGYHANWQSVRLPEKSLQLQIGIPLFTHRGTEQVKMPIGRLDVIAASSDPDVYDRIAELSEFMKDLSSEIDRVVARIEEDRKSEKAFSLDVISPAMPPLETIAAGSLAAGSETSGQTDAATATSNTLPR